MRCSIVQSVAQILTAVGLLLIGLVLAVGHAITGQAVVDAIAVSTLKVVHTPARHIQRW